MRSVIIFLFIAYYLSLSLGPLVYIGKIPLTSYHLFFIVLLLSVIYKLSFKKQNIYVFSYLKAYVIIMFIFMLLFGIKLLDVSYISSLRDYIILYSGLQYVLLVLVLKEVFRYKDLSITLVKINFFIMFLMGIISVLQILNMFNVPNILLSFYSKLNSSSRMEYLYWNPRSTATFNLEPNTFGLYMAFSLLMFHMFYDFIKFNKLILLIVYLSGLIGLLLSGSFTALVIYVLSSLVYFFIYKKISVKLIVSLSVIMLILSTVFYDNIEKSIKRQKLTSENLIPSSLKHRINDRWVKVYNDFEEHYLIGIGPSAIQLDYSTDNEYFDKFLRHGIIGGLVFCFFILFLIVLPFYERRNVEDKFLKKMLLFSSLLALCFALASLTGTAFKAKRVSELFWIFYSLPFIKLYFQKKNATKYVE